MAGRPPAHHSGRDSRDTDHRDTDHRNTGYRDTGYRDRDYRDRDYQAGYRDHSYRDRDYPAGYGHRDDEDRHYRDRLPSGYAERRGHTDDGRGWAGEDTGGLGRQDYWAGEDRDDWTGAGQRGWDGEDHSDWAYAGQRGWESGVWDWADEDRGDDGYREAGYQDDATGGAEGNERLTALTGSVLLVLFAAEGLTILSVHQLLTLHFFLSMLLIGPVALKACSVLYRFARYYTGAEEYRTKGPPAPLLPGRQRPGDPGGPPGTGGAGWPSCPLAAADGVAADWPAPCRAHRPPRRNLVRRGSLMSGAWRG
jgi:hypothetical protein